MNGSPRPILVCYDGSPAAARAIDTAGKLFHGHPAIVLYVSAREVRVAARREAAAVAEEGTSLAERAGLAAKSLTVETGEGAADAIVRLATQESAAAVVVARPSRTRRGSPLPGSVSRSVVDHCPVPVVLV